MVLSILFPPRGSSEHVGLAFFLLSTLLLSSRHAVALSSSLFHVNRLSLSKTNHNDSNKNSDTSMTTSSSLSSSSPSSSSTSSLEQDYVNLLKKLFQPVKNPSRHLGTTEIFQYRRQFFYDLYQEMQLHKNVKVIHVAGTKGKGSTCEYLASSLTAAGYRVGVFTSPHLHTARERIKIGRTLISIRDILTYGQEALLRLENHSWAVFFDYFLTIALLYFGRQATKERLDYLVLECGIGGRYDSTNFFPEDVDPAKHTTVITSISYDHQAILGDTLPEIAWQKAGIMRPGVKIFTSDQQKPEVLTTFQQEAEKVKANLVIVPADKLLLTNKGMAYDHRAQLQNCMLADAVLSQWSLSVKEGVSSFYWPCRLETFQFRNNSNNIIIPSSPSMKSTPSSTLNSPSALLSSFSTDSLTESNSNGNSLPVTDESAGTSQLIVLDGAHNGDSLRVFLQSLQEKYPHHHRLVVFGAGMEKSIDMMMQELFRFADKIVFVQSQHFKSYSEAQLLSKIPKTMSSSSSLMEENQTVKNPEDVAEENNKKVMYLPSMGSTLGGTVAHRLLHCIRTLQRSSHSSSQKPTVIGVCGSLFVAADAREALYRLDPTLFGENDWVRFADPPVF